MGTPQRKLLILPEMEAYLTQGRDKLNLDRWVACHQAEDEGNAFHIGKAWQGFPGGTMVKYLPANAADTGSSPGRGRSHMLQSN